jgi:hypothetical protein
VLFLCYMTLSLSLSLYIYIFLVGFEVLTAVVMKGSIFLDITPCSQLKLGLAPALTLV